MSNLVEGVVRLAVFLAYVWVVGFIPDIRRVFAYHGAEHMTVKAYEAGDPLEVQNVRKYSTAHPRCGTAFLLTVMVVAVIVFVWLGRPSLPWLVTSRLVLIPLIAALAYETIRFSASHQRNLLVKLITVPNLTLQRLTTPSTAERPDRSSHPRHGNRHWQRTGVRTPEITLVRQRTTRRWTWNRPLSPPYLRLARSSDQTASGDEPEAASNTRL